MVEFAKKVNYVWEQRKLDDWGNFYYGRSCPKWSVAEDATIPCIRYGELYTKFGAKIDKIYSYTNMSPENLRFSNGTEVLIPRVGEDPMDYNRCTWLSMPNVAIGEMISVFNTDNNPLFTATMFNATLQHEFAMRVEGGSVTNLYFDKLKNIEVSFPTKEEQEKIATYFDHLDHLITLHQRKIGIFIKKMPIDWEQRKLSDVVDSVDTGKSKFDKEGSSGEYPILGSTSVIGYDAEYDYEGDFILTARVGANAGSLYRHAGKVKISDNTVFIQASQNIEFLYQLLIRFDIKRLSFGTGQPLVKASELKRLELMMPTDMEEQMRIGVYFKNLDHLITLHHRKCVVLRKMKVNDWEQRKFSELYAKSSEKNDGSIGMDKNITVATMQFKENVKVSTAEYLKTYYTFNLGDIAFEGHQSKEFRYGRFVENDIGNGIVSHIFAVFRPIREYDLYFWKYAINNETLMQRILSRSTKASTMMHDLVTKDFLNEMFLVPSFDEQRQIGVFLATLDHLITLHQHKCDELQNLKKYMLQNMFV